MKIKVDLGSSGTAAGAKKVYDKIHEIKIKQNLDFELKKTSGVGMCYREPLVEIQDESDYFLYGDVDSKNIEKIIESHLKDKKALQKYLVKSNKHETKDDVFFEGQVKIALRNCGVIDPEIIEEYESNNGYDALRKIINGQLSKEDILENISKSGLRGRGGGGFPTAIKWQRASENKSDEKYIICNADEGDPGAFMDRSLLEGDPHTVIEGMIIGAYVIGANEGYIYCRAEYPLAIKRLNIALEQARNKGYLGKNILGKSGFNLEIHLKEGAGAFVCGEETALIASIEGERGMPRKRPPYPAQKGLWNKPSNINNVETFANVPYIIHHGWEAYAKYGTEKSKGTKVFALAGKIKHGGLVEVPMGITINDIIFKLGGGIENDKEFKAVQLGGPSGGCIPARLGDIPIDYDSLNATGAIMGSGGLVVMDETTCMVDMARFFLDFTQKESCGKCTFCRIGTKRMLEILDNIIAGNGKDGDIERLENLSVQIKMNSLCGLGQSAPNPVLTTIKYFREEFETHIYDKKCPAKQCKALLTYEIKDNCTGCMICAKNCPTNAIDGEKKSVHFIRQNDCIKCGICFSKCPFDAINIY